MGARRSESLSDLYNNVQGKVGRLGLKLSRKSKVKGRRSKLLWCGRTEIEEEFCGETWKGL